MHILVINDYVGNEQQQKCL